MTDALTPLDVDRLVHEPARLTILAHLHVVDAADFTWLAQSAGLTKGNLSSHMSKLEDAGYLKVDKDFVDGKPNTMLRITAAGRRALKRYRAELSRVLDQLPE